MGESLMQMFHGASSAQAVEDEMFDSDSLSSDSENSVFSSSSSDLAEDASSSSPDGPLYDLSSIMEDLPIKRGLSKYYQGKSQSFACLSDVSCLEDLAKKGSPLRRKLKSSKSYGRLDASQKRSYAPGPHSKAISKRVSRNTVVSFVVRRSSDSFLCSSKPPTIPHNRNIWLLIKERYDTATFFGKI